jgi:WD40 repeat protein
LTVSGNTVYLWDVRSSPIIGRGIAFAGRDNRTAATIRLNGIGLWDTVAGKLLKEGLGGAGQILQSIAVSPDGKMLIAGGSKGAALFCDIGKGQCSPLNMQDGNPITNAAFSPTGKLFALGSLNSLRLWVPGASTFDKSVPSLRSSSVVFQPGSGTLLAAGGDSAQLVDISSGKPSAKLADSDPSYVRTVAFSLDGQLLAYGRDDGTIIFRDAHSSTHAELARVRAGKAVYALAFSSDGGTLASGDEGGNLQLWDLGRPAARAAGQLQVKAIGEPVRRNTVGLRSLSFSADASKVATAGMDWVAGVWDATPAGWLEQICQKAGRNLTNAEWQQYAAGVPYVKSCPNLPGPK